jgi:diguanylate cyclase (GGDEF)-like protein/PAS domain S-box-containing protein
MWLVPMLEHNFVGGVMSEATPLAVMVGDCRLTDEQILRIVSRHIGATISVYDRDLVFRYVSDGFARWFGMTAEAMVGLTLMECYGEHNFTRYLPYIKRTLDGENVTYERQVREPSGFDGWRTVSLVPWRDDAGKVVGVVNSALSVHELKTTTEALRVANQRLLGHMENSPLAVIEFDADLVATHCSPRAQNMFGWSSGEGVLASLDVLLGDSGDGGNQLRLAFKLLQNNETTSNRVETRHVRPDGRVLHCEWFNSALTDASAKVVSIMSLVQDVSSRVQAAEQLRYMAEHDSLTGLPNRAALHTHVERALKRACRTRELVALLFIDLDGFKTINDTFGHGAGDEVLREVARRIRAAVRSTDVVARLGGDEFVVMLDTNVDVDTADLVSNRILVSLRETFYFSAAYAAHGVHTEGQANIGASIGVAMHPPLESHADSLFKRADAAMYDAKRAGKDCVRYANVVETSVASHQK